MIPYDLLASPAHRVMNANEHRALYCLFSALGDAGHRNEGLLVTHVAFEGAGVNHKQVASTLRVLEALGLIECTRECGKPNLYRLTFLPRTPTADDATNEHLRIATAAEARAIARAHRFRGPTWN
jgi:hypothetical protein